MRISVIIPALDEEAAIEGALRSCAKQAHEVIVVDGSSRDQTIPRAVPLASAVISTKPGRGRQQHAGACRASGDVLLFLHADTRLPVGFPAMIASALQDPSAVFGAFALGVDRTGPGLKAVCFGANLRTRLLRAPYGDQALFVRKEIYFKIGGFRDLPLMEDVDLVRRLRRMGGFRMAQGRALTSARRWETDGILRRTLGNYSLILRCLAGASPETLKKKYRDVR